MAVDEREVEAGVGEGERGPSVGAVTATLHGLVFRGQDVLDVTESAFLEPPAHVLVPPLVVLHAGERGDPSGEPERTAPRAELRAPVHGPQQPREQPDGRWRQPWVVGMRTLIQQLTGPVVDVARRPVRACGRLADERGIGVHGRTPSGPELAKTSAPNPGSTTGTRRPVRSGR